MTVYEIITQKSRLIPPFRYAIIKRQHNSRKRKREAKYDKKHEQNLLNGHVFAVKQEGSKKFKENLPTVHHGDTEKGYKYHYKPKKYRKKSEKKESTHDKQTNDSIGITGPDGHVHPGGEPGYHRGGL